MMGLKKIGINFAIISFAFILFFIWYQYSIVDSAQEAVSNGKRYKVYLITVDKGYEYWGILNQGATDMANLLNVNYIWDAPAVSNTEKQIQLIQNAVDNGANAILVAADNPKKISGVIEDAKARSVKIIYVDSPAYEEAITTLATDNYQAGVLAGQTMIKLLDRKGIQSGSIGIVNIAQKANTELRDKGFREVLEKDGRYKVLDTVYTVLNNPVATQEVAENIIRNNKDLVALYGTNERASIGVGNANKAYDNKYIAVGFDKTNSMMQLLNEGSLNAIINQNPYTMGYLGVAEAVAAIQGKSTGPEFIDTGVEVIEKP